MVEPLSIGFVSVAARELHRASDYLSVCSCIENISTFIHFIHTHTYIYIYTLLLGMGLAPHKARTCHAQKVPQGPHKVWPRSAQDLQQIISSLKMKLFLKCI